jgi:hypothetical protein
VRQPVKSKPNLENFDVNLNAIIDEIEQHAGKLPPVQCWNPPLSGDIDIVIRANQEWVHEGAVIGRPELVQLFSSILKREGDEYFLVTPVEKWRLTVEEAPFCVVDMELYGKSNKQVVALTTVTRDRVILGPENPLEMRVCNEQLKPFIPIRDNLEALIGRNVYYRLVEQALEKDGRHGVWSQGEFFFLE